MPVDEAQESARPDNLNQETEAEGQDPNVDLAHSGVHPDEEPQTAAEPEADAGLRELQGASRAEFSPDVDPSVSIPLDQAAITTSGFQLSQGEAEQGSGHREVLGFATGKPTLGGNPVTDLRFREFGISEMLSGSDSAVIARLSNPRLASRRQEPRIDNLFRDPTGLGPMESRELGERGIADRQAIDIASLAQSHITPRISGLDIGEYAVPSLGRVADPDLLRNLAGRVQDGARDRFDARDVSVRNLRFTGRPLNSVVAADRVNELKDGEPSRFRIAA